MQCVCMCTVCANTGYAVYCICEGEPEAVVRGTKIVNLVNKCLWFSFVATIYIFLRVFKALCYMLFIISDG